MIYFVIVAAILVLVFLFAFVFFFRSIRKNERSTHLSRSRFYWGRQEHLPDDFINEDKQQNV